jgi:hypothetical protein
MTPTVVVTISGVREIQSAAHRLCQYLRGRRTRDTRVSDQAEAGHGCSGDRRDADITSDDGCRNSGDAGLSEDRKVAGITEIDSCFQAARNASDVLGSCRKRD